MTRKLRLSNRGYLSKKMFFVKALLRAAPRNVIYLLMSKVHLICLNRVISPSPTLEWVAYFPATLTTDCQKLRPEKENFQSLH
jgi:hypothetical protein